MLKMNPTWKFGLSVVFCTCLAFNVAGEVIVLKDGTRLEGTVIPRGDGYWIKMSSGQTRTVSASDVASIGDGKKGAASSGAEPGGTTPHTEAKPGGSATFRSTRSRADTAVAPVAAIALWQKFVEANPSSEDRTLAEQELARWQELADGNAERINGKWVSGKERDELLKKVGAINDEAVALLRANKTLQALKRFEDGAKIYPNSYPLNFQLGRVYMSSGNIEKSFDYFDRCVRLRPEAPEALSNLALVLYAKEFQERAILLLFKAAQISDSEPLARNFVKAIADLPEGMRKNTRIKPAMDAAALLASKYNIPLTGKWDWVVLAARPEALGADQAVRAMSYGTGFVIREDGLILTNRHVVGDKPPEALLVVLDGNVRRAADVVSIDNEQDLALIRIRTDAKLPTVGFSATDTPAAGAACFAIGFPLPDRMGTTLKVTQGIVSGNNAASAADVVIDAKVNPGNSGGPLLDKHGSVIGIVTMKSRTTEFEDSYGMAISAGHIREFLAKNKIDLAAGPATAATQTLDAEAVTAHVRSAVVSVIATRTAPQNP